MHRDVLAVRFESSGSYSKHDRIRKYWTVIFEWRGKRRLVNIKHKLEAIRNSRYLTQLNNWHFYSLNSVSLLMDRSRSEVMNSSPYRTLWATILVIWGSDLSVGMKRHPQNIPVSVQGLTEHMTNATRWQFNVQKFELHKQWAQRHQPDTVMISSHCSRTCQLTEEFSTIPNLTCIRTFNFWHLSQFIVDGRRRDIISHSDGHCENGNYSESIWRTKDRECRNMLSVNVSESVCDFSLSVRVDTHCSSQISIVRFERLQFAGRASINRSILGSFKNAGSSLSIGHLQSHFLDTYWHGVR